MPNDETGAENAQVIAAIHGTLMASATHSMSKRKFTRPILGDIVEIPLSKGFAYAQYVYKHTTLPIYGPLIRIFPGTFRKRPVDFSGMAANGERFVTFYPLGPSVHQKLTPIVAHEPVPERFKKLPLFKSAGIRIPGAPEAPQWWLWDGEKSWRVPTLSDEEKRLPLKGIISFPLLVDRVESGWAPEDEVPGPKGLKKKGKKKK